MSATADAFRSSVERDQGRRRLDLLRIFSPSRENTTWFLAVFIPALLGGWWLVYVAEIWVGDALSRVNQAYSVVLGRDPHLGAIGFIWPPLPSALEIPLVLVIGPFAPPVFAGQIVFRVLLRPARNRAQPDAGISPSPATLAHSARAVQDAEPARAVLRGERDDGEHLSVLRSRGDG